MKGLQIVLSLPIIHAGLQAANTLAIAHSANSTAFTELTNSVRVLKPHPLPAICNDPFVAIVRNGLNAIIGIGRALGVAVAVHSIVMAGLIRMLSFGNERKIAESNSAIASAVMGLIIVLLSVVLGNDIVTWFGQLDHTCLIGPAGSSIPS